MSRTATTILDVLSDPALFGRWFTPAESWGAWRAFLAALFGLPMSEADLDVFRRCTGRARPPASPAREAWSGVQQRKYLSVPWRARGPRYISGVKLISRRYRTVAVQIWGDEKFCSLSDDGKLAFLFLLTHPAMTSVGAMRATIAGA